LIVEIDDAGTGDIIGDAIIGFYLPDKDIFVAKNIPVEYFQNPAWKNDFPMKYTVEIINSTLSEINFNRQIDLIHICSGNIFDMARDYFKDNKINFKNVKIEGKLQDLVEQAFIDHLRQIGVRSKKITIESGKKRFFQLFNWVAYKYPKRRQFVKSGFKNWEKKWEAICEEQYRKNLEKARRKRTSSEKRHFSRGNKTPKS
jgi:hypothetical protein